MSKTSRFLLIVALLAVAGIPAMAQRPDKPANPKGPKDQPAVRVVFRDSDRAVFREYYGARRAEYRPLPLGISRNLVRGKPLPPGIVKTRVPDAVLVQLPWRPRDHTLFLVGDRIVLLNANGRVADILSIF